MHDYRFIPMSQESEMGKLIRSTDWASTPLGAPETWPQSLCTSVSTCLNSRFPILLWWGKELVMIYNDAYVPILGTKHPTSLGAPGEKVWPEIWHIIGPMLQGVLNEGKATWSENQLLLLERDGFPEECYFTFSYSPIHVESGEIGGVFCAVYETTESVISARRLSTLKQLSDPDITFKTEPEIYRKAERTLNSNPADFPLAKLYIIKNEGKSAELINSDERKGFAQKINITDNTGASGCLKQTLKSKQAVSTEIKSFTQKAEDHLDKAFLIPVMQPQKDVPYAILFSAIGPNTRVDQNYKSFLQLTADHIASEISQVRAFEEERKQIEALQEIDRAKTVFFSNISHEFRTPLTLMLGPLEETVNNKRLLLTEAKDNIETAYRNTQRLSKLVNSLLDFSRIEAGRMQASYQLTDICKLTRDLASTFRSAMEKAGLEFVVKCEDITEPVYVDRDMWEKIVINLLSNAFKYTHEGRIEIHLSQAGNVFRLTVSDTGAGIPERELNKIFERFYRASSVHGRSQEGTGIGLSLVNELIKLHRGTINVKSEVAKGSIFTVDIPTGKEHLPEKNISANHSPQAGLSGQADAFVIEALKWVPQNNHSRPSRNAHTPKTLQAKSPAEKAYIMVVDDNADMREYIQRLLSPHYQVTAVENGKLALSLIRQKLPDLIISDVMMPEIDGFQLLKNLKDDLSTTNIPIILLSARAGEEATIQGLEAGADDYLIKPFSAKELLSRVESNIKIFRNRYNAEQQLHNLFMQAPALIGILLGKEGICTLCNPLFAKLWGNRDVIGKPMREAWPELEGQGYFETVEKVFKTGKPAYGNEYPAIADWKNTGIKTRAFFNFIFTPYYGTDGKILGTMMFGNEVTEQVEARQKAEFAEERLRLATEATGLATWDLNLKTDEIVYSKRLTEIFGIKKTKSFTHKDMLSCLHTDDLLTVQKAFQNAVKTGIYNYEARLIRPDKSIRWIRTQGKVFFDDHLPSRMLGTIVDITDKKEEEIRKNDFIAMASHELKTPLTSLKAYIQLIDAKAKKNGDDFLKTTLAKADVQANKMTKLITDFLDLSKVESGKLRLSLQSIDMNQLIKESIADIEPVLERHTLIYHLPGQAIIHADKEKICHVITNLINNAIKYSPDGGKIIIKTEVLNESVHVSVSDSGVGIKPQDQKNIFERFYRVKNKSTQIVSGFGIGLYLSKEIIDRHKGKIWVESEPGKGSMFFFSLPLHPKHLEDR